MRRKPIGVVLMCAAIIVAAGCAGAQVYNLSNVPVAPIGGKEPTLDEVTKAIMRAAARTTPAWRMKVINPGQIRAMLFIRQFTATVDIKYTTKSYSITYVDSTNLKYDAKDKTIHPKYNSWIRYLERAINYEIAGI
jgi:hypothetical protein